ncbi:indoleamine 2,3-dioxygenase 1 [Rhinatrema bivittatum]|uniref:indoleamine 2,3-dioxygenase 1 n=1 Tax=Rhinatrema bivittatum TaxID=194408 RepID=UPI0011262920|nr:indoleamine 2,3-dioxygenase 1 [Rhinatrema bivittatum]
MEQEAKASAENPLIKLDQYCISEDYGFVLPHPQTHLPSYYDPWMEIATSLPQLIENHQLRSKVQKMPLLSTGALRDHKEQRLAHLALGLITMGYVWQEGDEQVLKVLPEALAVPFCKVSEVLDLPPVLVYADCVLANWKMKDPSGQLNIENLDIIFSFPGGETAKGFFLVSLLVEIAAAPGIKAIPKIISAMLHQDMSSLENALQDVTSSIFKMLDVFKLIHDYVNPEAFFNTLRIYLSGWKGNPLMEGGLLYEGVWKTPREFSGGSAGQSSTLQCFDVLLGIHSDPENGSAAAYLQSLRDYMPASHRAFIQAIASGPSLRHFVLAGGDSSLKKAFNSCVCALAALRDYHIQVVTRYITIPAGKRKREGCLFHSAVLTLAEKGTGGTRFMCLLKTIRNATKKAQLLDVEAL